MTDLQHENIVQVFGLASNGRDTGVVLECMGLDLFKYLHQPSKQTERPLSLDRQRLWSLHIVKGLQYLHSQHLIHGNLKSLNIMLSHDLSLAKLSGFMGVRSALSSSVYVAVGVPRNTVEYDINCLGLVLFEIYTRQLLESADVQSVDATAKDIIQQCLSADKPSTQSIIQALGSELIQVRDIHVQPDDGSSNVFDSPEYNLAMEFYNIQKFRTAFIFFEKEAALGSTEAEFRLGHCYYYGRGVNLDYKQAFFWFSRASANNHKEAMLYMSYLYKYGNGVRKDPSKAEEWSKRASKVQSADPEQSVDAQVTDQKILELYTQQAEENGPDAKFEMGNYFLNGEIIQRNDRKAMEWYLKAAAEGHPQAQFKIGYLYHHGYGVDRDLGLAREWYLKAAEQGDPQAQFSVACLYENRCGVEKDYQKAMEWYLKAAEQGSALAQFGVARLYHHGYGVEKDYALAREWYKKAHAGRMVAATIALRSLPKEPYQ